MRTQSATPRSHLIVNDEATGLETAEFQGERRSEADLLTTADSVARSDRLAAEARSDPSDAYLVTAVSALTWP
jgi:hypothetical protein